MNGFSLRICCSILSIQCLRDFKMKFQNLSFDIKNWHVSAICAGLFTWYLKALNELSEGKLVDSVMESSRLNREKCDINIVPICYQDSLFSFYLLWVRKTSCLHWMDIMVLRKLEKAWASFKRYTSQAADKNEYTRVLHSTRTGGS